MAFLCIIYLLSMFSGTVCLECFKKLLMGFEFLVISLLQYNLNERHLGTILIVRVVQRQHIYDYIRTKKCVLIIIRGVLISKDPGFILSHVAFNYFCFH